METRTPRRRLSRAERERQILDAALEVFGERGFQSASMDAVAERVGVTKPVLYTHFGSKDGLLLACIARAGAELLAATRRAAQEARGPEEMIRRCTLAFFRHLDEHEPAWKVIYEEASVSGDALEGLRTEQAEFIATMLAAHAPDADPRRLTGWAHVIVGAGERLAVWRSCEPSVTPEQATEYLMDLVWRGLATMAG